ncbi:MAG: RNA recognition motif domain-containing protein [Candidatus Binataceae bacterium]
MKLYVGNLPYNTSPRELQDAFSAHVGVKSVEIPTDSATGKPRGFGFVELISEADAQTAIDALNGTQLGGRTIRVNVAQPPRSHATTRHGGEE